MVREIALYYGQTLGYVGWNKIAVISTSDVYGVDLAQSFIKNVFKDISTCLSIVDLSRVSWGQQKSNHFLKKTFQNPSSTDNI